MLFLPEALEPRYGINPGGFEIARAVAASANLVTFGFRPYDPNLGGWKISDKNHRSHRLIDPGYNRTRSMPSEKLQEEIKKYKDGQIDLPPFYFIVGNQPFHLSKLGSIDTTNLDFPTGIVPAIISWISEKVDAGCKDPVETINEIGVRRAYTVATCATVDPATHKLAMLNTGNLAVPTPKRETLICANIPTAEFQSGNGSVIDFETQFQQFFEKLEQLGLRPTIRKLGNLKEQFQLFINQLKALEFQGGVDQLYTNLVDGLYVSNAGESGLSPSELYIRDIDSTNPQEYTSEPKHLIPEIPFPRVAAVL